MIAFSSYETTAIIDNVSKNIGEYFSMRRYGIRPWQDYIPSGTTSVIVFDGNQHIAKDKGHVYIRAMEKENEKSNLFYDYDAIFGNLSPQEQTLLELYFDKRMSISKIERGSSSYKPIHDAWMRLQHICLRIGVVDPRIECAVADLDVFEQAWLRDTYDDISESKYLISALWNTKQIGPYASKLKSDIERLASFLPEKELQAFADYVTDHCAVQPDWKCIRRAFHSIRYGLAMYNGIEIDDNEYLRNMQHSGNGWKCCYEIFTTKLGGKIHVGN